MSMSSKQSGKKKEGGYVTIQACNASQEALLSRGERYYVWDDCPLCLQSGARVRVGNHRTDQPTPGNKILESML
jgi:hypothetical protein